MAMAQYSWKDVRTTTDLQKTAEEWVTFGTVAEYIFSDLHDFFFALLQQRAMLCLSDTF